MGRVGEQDEPHTEQTLVLHIHCSQSKERTFQPPGNNYLIDKRDPVDGIIQVTVHCMFYNGTAVNEQE